MPVECDLIFDAGRAICLRCGRSYSAPAGRLRAHCTPRDVVVTRRLPGPGTEMKALLAKIGIVASPTCSCNKRAKIMDEKGCDWCEANIDTISGWLAEEAKKRKLPYAHAAGKMLIRLAIRRARKKGTN